MISIFGMEYDIASDGFKAWAEEFLKYYYAVPANGVFSPVPFFLCCRSIELSLKAIHLRTKSTKKVKDAYSHNLTKAYQALETKDQTLTAEELKLLNEANSLYAKKDFEYFAPLHALLGYSHFPDISQLASLARKLLATA